MNNPKKLLIAVLVTNLICTFAAGHGAIPLGLLELLTLYSTATLNFDEFPLLSFWTLAAVTLIIGQVFTIIAIRKRELTDMIKFGRFGSILLLTPLIIITLSLKEHVWTVAVVSSIPFFILTIAFWWTTTISKAYLPINGT